MGRRNGKERCRVPGILGDAPSEHPRETRQTDCALTDTDL